MTQQELAHKVGCSVSAIFKIESDERRPSRQITELLAKHLEIPPDQISLFMKIARKEKSAEYVEAIPSLSTPRLLPVKGPPKTNLPVPINPLVGREHELAVILQQIQDPQCRLLTLTGPGGTGKTRLALEAAYRLQGDFEEGAFFIPLVGITDARYIVPATINAIGLELVGSNDPKRQVLNYLREKETLLVFDNLEHLLDEGSDDAGITFLGELVQEISRVKIITTSRQKLELSSEWVFDIEGLPVPRASQINDLEGNSAAALFLQRAHQADMAFSLSEKEWPAVMRICQLVEGLPLGIELAAAWVRTLSCLEIAEELEKGLDTLSVHTRDLPERHRSLQATMDYSWKLLAFEERQVLARLTVFKGSFDRQAAEKVADAPLSVLYALVDKSLLRRLETGRYELHELIRQYAHEQLSRLGALVEACDRHLDHYIQFVLEAKAKLTGPDQIFWLDRLEEENDNLRAALEWSLRSANPDPQKSLQLAGALHGFWKRRDHWKEGREWLRRALERTADLPGTPEKVAALNAAALLAMEQADTRAAGQYARQNLLLAQELGYSSDIAAAFTTLGVVLWKQKRLAEARSYAEQGLALFRKLGDPDRIADCLHWLGHIATNQGDLEATQLYLEESLAISREINSKIGIAEAIGDLGLLAYLRKEPEKAQTYLEESLVRFREAHLMPGVVSALNRLGDVARQLGAYEKAGDLYADALSLYRETGDLDEIPSILHNMGYIALHRLAGEQAMALFQEALAIHQQTGNLAGIAECVTGIAAVLIEQGRTEKTARLFGAAESMREKAGAILWPANQVEYKRSLALLSCAMEEAVLTCAWQEGRALSIEDAIHLAVAQ